MDHRSANERERRFEVDQFRLVMGGSGKGEPDPNVASLRSLRRATRDYLIVCEAASQAMDNDAVRQQPDLHYLRAELEVATGKRGHGGFGTPVSLEHRLTQLLGEA